MKLQVQKSESSILRFYQVLLSSIFLKLIMGVTGLLLILFVLGHLLGNFTLLVPEGGRFTGETFLSYSESMEETPLLKVIESLFFKGGEFRGESFLNYAKTLHKMPFFRFWEILLFATFITHILLGFNVIAQNIRARPKRYKIRYRKGKGSISTISASYTGVAVLAFLIIHLINFSFSGARHGKEMFNEVLWTFSNPFYLVAYTVFLVFLGLHVSHGFQSAFQTIGWNHRKYNLIINFFSKILAFFIFLGFAIIPVFVYLFYEGGAK